MFPKERRKEILAIVNTTGFATVEDLSKRFEVSVDSIRKDLKSLQREGKIKREYGGALKIEPAEKKPANKPIDSSPTLESIVADAEARAEEGRKSVAARAWLEINDGDAIFLGVSRTNLHLADLIAAGDKRLIVTTNMIDVLTRVSGNPKVTALATGGYLNVDERVLKNASYRFLLADSEKFRIHSGYRWASITDFTAIITDSTDPEVLRAIQATGTPVLC